MTSNSNNKDKLTKMTMPQILCIIIETVFELNIFVSIHCLCPRNKWRYRRFHSNIGLFHSKFLCQPTHPLTNDDRYLYYIIASLLFRLILCIYLHTFHILYYTICKGYVFFQISYTIVLIIMSDSSEERSLVVWRFCSPPSELFPVII